ncbi:hypothetical protein [Methylovulum sp.]|uniref:hypothetical protein n=1 Tax=Methylovulum sp. TaxID=1916980 RepID=UPI0026099677|nr:hypothetical protein [Methylovulum sp.]MDD5125266.1 hypothetical protein [Methylovulum sp.]
MDKHNMPSAWAKLRASIYLYGGMVIIALMVLALAGILSPVAFAAAYFVLMPTVLVAGFPNIFANLTGNLDIQAKEELAWKAATAPIRLGYQRAFRSEHQNPLREMGAIGMDLLEHIPRLQTIGHQPCRRKVAGSGRHKKPASSESEDSRSAEPPTSLPLLCTVHDLASLLQVSAKTLQNKPKVALPPAIYIPGCRGPRYHLRDVIAWLDSFPVKAAKPQGKPKGRIGRPRIATPAQIAAVRGKGVRHD